VEQETNWIKFVYLPGCLNPQHHAVVWPTVTPRLCFVACGWQRLCTTRVCSGVVGLKKYAGQTLANFQQRRLWTL